VPPTTPASASRIQALGHHPPPTIQAQSFDDQKHGADNPSNVPHLPDPLTDDSGQPVNHGSDTLSFNQETQAGSSDPQAWSMYPLRSTRPLSSSPAPETAEQTQLNTFAMQQLYGTYQW
jgi:hypothetical protein